MASGAMADEVEAATPVVARGVFVSSNVVLHNREDIRRIYELGCYGSSATTASLKPLFLRKKRRRFRDLDADANHAEPWKLTLLEAFYLISEGSLDVRRTSDGDKLDDQEAWSLFGASSCFSSPRRFAVMYAAYRHLRRQNWVIKMGQTYGGHFAIYQGDPDFFHSQFCVVIRDADDGPLPWIDVTREMRVANQTGKELMVCEVSDLDDANVPGAKANVEFTIMLRWVLQHEQVGKERAPHRKLAQKLVDPAQKVARRQKDLRQKKEKKKQKDASGPAPPVESAASSPKRRRTLEDAPPPGKIEP